MTEAMRDALELIRSLKEQYPDETEDQLISRFDALVAVSVSPAGWNANKWGRLGDKNRVLELKEDDLAAVRERPRT